METKHPIESLMITSMTSIESMVDVNTIIGDILNSSAIRSLSFLLPFLSVLTLYI